MEWTSLILFTVLSEAAVGLVLVHALFGLTRAARDKAESYAGLGRTVLLVALLTTGLAMLISLEHLGWPQFAFRALGGLPSSWLSWEVLLTGLFASGALLLRVASRSREVPLWAYAGLALVGLAATYASGMIYALPSIPANAGGFPPLLFLSASFVLGPVTLLLLLAVSKHGKALAPDWTPTLALFAVGAIILAGALTLAYTGAASAGLPEARLQAHRISSSAWYWIRLLAGLGVPALLLLRTARRPRLTMATAAVPAVLVAGGELVGRTLFFTASVFTGVNSGF